MIDRADIATGRVGPIGDAFHTAHARVYDHSDPKAEVQVVNLRLVVSGSAPKPSLTEQPVAETTATAEATAQVFVDGSAHTAQVYARAQLSPGHHFAGPAIVTQDDCTTVVPPGMTVRVDGWNNLLIAVEN